MPFGRAVSSGPDFGPSGEPGNALIVGLLAGFVVVWTAYLSIGHAPFPILHDMSEAYVWGREFQLGYNQHPPFWAWVCGAWFLALPQPAGRSPRSARSTRQSASAAPGC